MKKKYKVQDVDCADCAARMEEAISKLDGVKSAKLNFLTEKLTLEVDEDKLDKVLELAEAEMKKIDSEACIVR